MTVRHPCCSATPVWAQTREAGLAQRLGLSLPDGWGGHQRAGRDAGVADGHGGRR
jgi:hypothetical protein